MKTQKLDSVFMAVVGVAVLVCAFAFSMINKRTEEQTVLSIDKVENTSGDSNGFSTEVYYIVTTDKGVYRIETTGFNAHPECAGMKKDSTYMITTRGVNVPYLGMYQSVIAYR